MKQLKQRFFQFLGLSLFTIPAAIAQKFDLDELNDGVEDQKDSIFGIIENVILVALVIGVIGVVWQMSQDMEQGKKYMIGWVIAAVFYVLVFQFMGIG